MGTVRKVGQEYFIEFEARGLKYQQKAGPDEKAAQKLLDEIESKIQRGEMSTIVRDMALTTFWEDFLSYATAQYPSWTTHRFERVIRHFQEFVSVQFPQLEKLSQITPKIVEAYKSHLRKSSREGVQIKNNVINLTLLLLREILEHGIRLGLLNDNPALHVAFVPGTHPVVPVLSDEQLVKIFIYASPQLQQVARIILATGLHPREICQLNEKDVNQHAHEFMAGIPKSRGRSFISRRIPLTPVIVEIFRQKGLDGTTVIFGQGGESLSWQKLEQEWQNCCQQAQVAHRLRLVDLRHAFARQVVVRGLSLVRLATILGFSDVAGVVKYVGFIPDVHERFQKGF